MFIYVFDYLLSILFSSAFLFPFLFFLFPFYLGENAPLLRGSPADNPLLAIEMKKMHTPTATMAMKGKVVPVGHEAAFILRDPEGLRRGKWL